MQRGASWRDEMVDRVASISEDELRRVFGDPTFRRGVLYAASGAVRELRFLRERRMVRARVLGSHGRVYTTSVDLPGPGRGLGASACTCPVGVDCKHAVAVLLVARDPGGADRAAAGTPRDQQRWERILDPLLEPGEEVADVRGRLGLQLEHVDAGSRTPRLRIRPVVRGRSSWVRTGISWRSLEAPTWRGDWDLAQREVVAELLAVHRSRMRGYGYSYQEPTVHLDELGPSCWRLLSAARDAGITLVGAGAHPVVELLASDAVVAVDVRRLGAADGLQLTCHLHADGTPLDGAHVLVIGSPAHLVACTDGEVLRLARPSRPLDATLTAMLRAPLAVPPADEADFLTRYYPVLRRAVPVESGDRSVDLPEVRPPRLQVDVAFEPEHVAAVDWCFVYEVGEARREVPLDGADLDRARDAEAERRLLERLPFGGGASGASGPSTLGAPRRTLRGLDTAGFVEDLLPLLERDGEIDVRIGGVRPRFSESAEPPVIAVAALDSDDPDWFDLRVTVTLGDQAVPLAPLLAAIALGEPTMLLPSGTWFRLDRPELVALRELIEEARQLEDRTAETLRLSAVQASWWEDLVGLGVVAEQSERWARTTSALSPAADAPLPGPPVGLKAELRPYQLEGYQWLSLLWDLRLGGVLADDMGLGKTLQTLAMAVRASANATLGADAGPLLIVAPTSVVGTWAAEAARFCPGLAVEVVRETVRKSGQDLAELAKADIVVTSFTLFRIDEAHYRAVRWCGLVLDEAQFVKNYRAKTYRCARLLPAPFKLAITGTPLENSLMDLWGMLSITAPGLFPDPERFAETFQRPIEGGHRNDRLATLRRRVRPVLLRRTKEQVASDLPPKTDQRLAVTLNPKHRRIYETHLNRERQRVLHLVDDLAKNRIAILRSLTVLRQLSLDASLVDPRHAGQVGSSKLDVLVEYLHELAAEGHRALVFSQFTRFLAIVRARLDAEGISHCYLDGRTRDRSRRITEFNEGNATAFLISLKAGGFGLNLTAADYVFLLDPWWNPATEEQAIDRTHRIGQDKPVMVYRLVASETIEEKVVALQERKRELFSKVIDDGGMLGRALTVEDIRELFAR